MKGSLIDMVGYRRGRATVLSREGVDNSRRATWRCVCDCGNEFVMIGCSLRNNKVPSCGCAQKEVATKVGRANTSHGETNTRLYNIWTAMKSRCYNPKNSRYKYYGGVGLTVTESWRESYEDFRDWALANGYRESLSIDRIDNSKGYFPENCRWADDVTQNRNRSNSVTIEYRGKKMNVMELSEKLGIKEGTIRYRHRNGLPLDEPLRKKKGDR